MPTFTPPTSEDNSPVADRKAPALSKRLFRYYTSRDRGRSVLKAANGTYTTVDWPSQDQLDSAVRVYLGGHVYFVNAAEKAALEAAGYTVDPADPPGHRSGLTWGDLHQQVTWDDISGRQWGSF